MLVSEGNIVVESAAGRAVVVTGGSTGIGRMIAEGFASAGATVFICARNGDRCRSTAADISAAYPGTCVGLQADISTKAGAADLASQVARHVGAVHVLVNNAGSVNVQPIEEYSEEGWDRTVDINLKSPFFTTQQFLPLLRKEARPERPASVINIASVGGMIVGARENYAYSASKAGAIHLTHLLSKWLARYSITVNCIAPGLFPSEIIKREMDAAAVQETTAQIPLGRFGDPKSMGGLAQFIASSFGTYMTGAVIPLDGGFRF